MPWVSLFDVYPDAVFRNYAGDPVPVVDGRVDYEFEDIGSGGGFEECLLDLAGASHRLAFRDIVAVAAELAPSLWSNAGCGQNGGGEIYAEEVDGENDLEFNLVPWDYAYVQAGRTGI